MRFSVQTQQRHVEWPSLLSVWKELDQSSNFDGLWLVDHLATSLEGPGAHDGPCVEAWTALAALAQATQRVRVGTLVSAATHRHPSVLAKMATTVDQISGGRLELGIGTGWNAAEHHSFGIEFPDIATRFERLEETIVVIKKLWTESAPHFEGRHVQLAGPSFLPGNLQTPHPPILVGGNGERRTLPLVARHADASNLVLLTTPVEARRKFDILDRECEKVGRDPSQIRRTVELLLLDQQTADSPILQEIATKRGVDPAVAGSSILVGSVESKVETLHAYRSIGVDEIVIMQPHRLNLEGLLEFSDQVIPLYLRDIRS